MDGADWFGWLHLKLGDEFFDWKWWDFAGAAWGGWVFGDEWGDAVCSGLFEEADGSAAGLVSAAGWAVYGGVSGGA